MKIEKNVCIKGTHFLKFFCMFNTSSHLKKLLTTKNFHIFIRMFMYLRNVCEFQEMFFSNFLFLLCPKMYGIFKKCSKLGKLFTLPSIFGSSCYEFQNCVPILKTFKILNFCHSDFFSEF